MSGRPPGKLVPRLDVVDRLPILNLLGDRGQFVPQLLARVPFDERSNFLGEQSRVVRSVVEWFDDLGIVTRHDGHPAACERNDAYFGWRNINQFVTDHSVKELLKIEFVS